MANWTVGRPGQVNQGGATDALFLKLFSGEVLTTYQTECIFDGLVRSRSISGGKSAQFPVTGRVTASYHTAGTEIVGQATNQNEQVINVDDLLVAPVSIADIDVAKEQYDYRSIYSTECGRALARAKDSKLARIAILAARATAPVTDQPNGTQLTLAATDTDKEVLRAQIEKAALTLDINNTPENDRVVVLAPTQYYLLLESDKVVNKFYGDNGSIADANVNRLYKFSIRMSNNLPNGTIVGAVSGENNTYSGTFSKTVAIAFQKEAVGTVNLMSLRTQMEYSVSRQATLVVAGYSCGHGILRPGAAVELLTV